MTSPGSREPQPRTPDLSVSVCDLTLPSPEENLALDEALLDQCDASPEAGGILRFWEPTRPFVVLGYANHTATEVDLLFCRQYSIPVLRRCSGGGTVLQAPGCINYSCILPMVSAPELESIHKTNDFVLQRIADALTPLLPARPQKQGDTDLTLDGLKFSGNAQRRKRHALIFHGCILLDLDFALLAKALPMPSKQPAYRLNRPHSDFLVNLHLPPQRIKSAIVQTWRAQTILTNVPLRQTDQLVAGKYALPEWNFKF